jgi:hypothetical protein
VMWRANRRNVRLLQDWLHRVGDHQVKRASAARHGPSTIPGGTEPFGVRRWCERFLSPEFSPS